MIIGWAVRQPAFVRCPVVVLIYPFCFLHMLVTVFLFHPRRWKRLMEFEFWDFHWHIFWCAIEGYFSGTPIIKEDK